MKHFKSKSDEAFLLLERIRFHTETTKNDDNYPYGLKLFFQFTSYVLSQILRNDKAAFIANELRNRGNTYYLVKAAYDNPKVIIIFNAPQSKDYAMSLYEDMVEENPKDDDVQPIFISLNENIRGLPNYPVLFDNPCFC